MQQLFVAVHNLFTNDAPLSGSVTGLFLEVVGHNTAPPYITYSLIANSPRWVFGGKAMEMPLIQFSIVSNDTSDAEVCSIYGHLTAVYDWANLCAVGHSTVMMRRENASLRQPDEKWWTYTVDYLAMLQKT